MAAPKSWPIKRKENVFVIKSNPGPQKLENSMPIGLILKLLSQVSTTREARQVINQRKVLVNKRPARDIKLPAGLFDIIEFADNYFRVLLNRRGKLIFKDVSKTESNIILYKIIGKTRIKGNKLQLNFHNGFNLQVKDDDYNINDVLLIENNQIKVKISFEKGSIVYITKGKNLGGIAKIEEIYERPPFNKHVLVSIGDKKINLPKNYVFLVGKTKPMISLSEK